MTILAKKGFAKTHRYNLLTTTKLDEVAQRTVCIFQQAVSYYLQVLQDHQELLNAGNWLRACEILTHTTRHNPNPQYPFDIDFVSFPSGYRRAAIAKAYGLAKAWQTSYRKWSNKKAKTVEKNIKRLAKGKKLIKLDRPPPFPVESKSWVTFYGSEYKLLDQHHIMLKLYTGSAYSYFKIALVQPLVVPEGYVTGSPTLVKKASGWELHIPIIQAERQTLAKIVERIKDKHFRFCAMDLGINRHAVLTIQDTKGRVYATKCISGKKDNHLRKRYLEKIVRLQKKTRIIPGGERFAKHLWDKVRHLNDDIAHRVSKQILDFAESHGANVVVFEHLGNLRAEKGTKSRWLNQKFNHWVKGRIFRYTQYKGLHRNILSSRVNPKHTSKRCPYCGMLTIERYNVRGKGVDLAKCTNCGTFGMNSDFVGSLGIGQKFILRHTA